LFKRGVAEGYVVPAGNEIPDEKIAAGTHYKIMGDTLERHKKFWAYGKQLYIDLTKEYPDKFERMG
jgi:carbonic anhydrase/acetyltransferase-like protein (isoleucine patch superfamily)